MQSWTGFGDERQIPLSLSTRCKYEATAGSNFSD